MRRDPASNTLTAEQCWALISSQSVGRLALSVKALPTILPVQYYIDNDHIAICLGHHRVAPQSVDHTVAAFTVDSIPPEAFSQGWTVHITGMVQPPKPIGVPTDCGQPTAGQIVHLLPDRVTGQQIFLCPFL